MSKIIKPSGCAERTNESTPFVKVLDGRKQPIRNLWRRGDAFYARLGVASQSGAKVDKGIALKASTAADAKAELAKLRLQRDCARQVLEQMATLHSMDVVLPVKAKTDVRLRLLAKPDKLTADLLTRMQLSLPTRPKTIQNVVEKNGGQ
jgi:hypothetical protein